MLNQLQSKKTEIPPVAKPEPRPVIHHNEPVQEPEPVIEPKIEKDQNQLEITTGMMKWKYQLS